MTAPDLEAGRPFAGEKANGSRRAGLRSATGGVGADCPRAQVRFARYGIAWPSFSGRHGPGRNGGAGAASVGNTDLSNSHPPHLNQVRPIGERGGLV